MTPTGIEKTPPFSLDIRMCTSRPCFALVCSSRPFTFPKGGRGRKGSGITSTTYACGSTGKYNVGVYPIRYRHDVLLQPGTSTSDLNAADARPNDIQGLPVGSCDVKNSSNSFALRWLVLSSGVEKLICFALILL